MDNIARKIREETRQRGRDRKLRENVNKEGKGRKKSTCDQLIATASFLQFYHGTWNFLDGSRQLSQVNKEGIIETVKRMDIH